MLARPSPQGPVAKYSTLNTRFSRLLLSCHDQDTSYITLTTTHPRAASAIACRRRPAADCPCSRACGGATSCSKRSMACSIYAAVSLRWHVDRRATRTHAFATCAGRPARSSPPSSTKSTKSSMDVARPSGPALIEENDPVPLGVEEAAVLFAAPGTGPAVHEQHRNALRGSALLHIEHVSSADVQPLTGVGADRGIQLSHARGRTPAHERPKLRDGPGKGNCANPDCGRRQSVEKLLCWPLCGVARARLLPGHRGPGPGAPGIRPCWRDGGGPESGQGRSTTSARSAICRLNR